MYGSNTDFFEMATIISGFFSFIVALVFFDMVYNVSRIKRHLLKKRLTYEGIFEEIELEKFMGNTARVIDLHHQKAYLVLNDDDLDERERYKRMNTIATQIAEINGTIAPGLKEFLEKHVPKK